MIEIKNMSKVYQMGDAAVNALQDVSLKISSGEFIAIMGPSGSGKSTLLHILGFLDRPDSGDYIIFGKSVKDFSDNDLANLRNRYIGFVFQQFHLLKRMSALDNVYLPCIYGGDNKNSHEDAVQRLKDVGMQNRMSHSPNELSGGQQQKTAIARALINDPEILMADEPTGNLDSESEREIMSILQNLNAAGKTIIMVTHEPEIAEYANRIIKMRDGKIVSDEKKDSTSAPQKTHTEVKDIISASRSSINKDELIGYFKQAFMTITTNRVRSFLSMLGILVGVGAVIAMLALGAGAKSQIATRLESLGSNLLMVRGGSSKFHHMASGEGSVTRFTNNDVEDILRLGPVAAKVSGSVSGNVQTAYQNDNWSTNVEGTGVNYPEMRALTPTVGRWFTEDELKKREKVAIIGRTIVNKLFRDTNPIGQTIKLNRINFTVIGIAPEKGSMGPRDQDDAVYVPLTTAMYRLFGKDYLDTIYVEASGPDTTSYLQGKVEETIKRNHKLFRDEDTFNIRNMSEIQEMLNATMQTLSLLLGSIAAISLLVGGIGIMNIMLVSVTERTREIGLRKAIGARSVDIMSQFLIESIVMTLSGGIFGVILGSAAAFCLSFFAGWTVKITLFSVVLATTFSVFVGLFFGLWPAKRASQLNPVEALRYE